MQDHHRRAMELALEKLAAEDDVQVVLLGGSIAKGTERPESDVDLIVVVTDKGYAQRVEEDKVSFYFPEVADYPGGYVEGRFLSRTFLFEAAKRGSEPTRHSFTGVKAVWGDDPQVLEAVAKIPVYPEEERDLRLGAFYSQMVLNRVYFWPEGLRREDPYLKLRAASTIVLFGGRMILAFHRKLFQNQKRLMESLEGVEPGLAALGREFLVTLDDASMVRFCDAVTAITGVPNVAVGSRYTQDSEMSWFARTHDVAEW